METKTQLKKKVTVIIATRNAFHKLNNEFSVLNLIDLVRRSTKRPRLTDGTITRRLRELRADDTSSINYIVVDNKKAIYKKV